MQYRKSFFKNQPKSDEQNRIEQLDRQIMHTSNRLNTVGEDTDSRNWLEKALNLPERQNFLLDALEIVQRPFQGVTNVVNTMTSPHDARGKGEAFMEGLSGKNQVYGSDILGDMGMEGNAKHIIGFGADVLLDPTTFIPGAAFTKAGKVVGGGVKAITPAPVKRLAGKVGDGVGTLFKNDARALGRTLDGEHTDDIVKLMQELSNMANHGHAVIAEGATKAAKYAGVSKETFEQFGKEVARIMEDSLEQFNKVKEYINVDGTVFTDKQAFSKHVKNQIKEAQKEISRVSKMETGYNKELNELSKQLREYESKINKMVTKQRNETISAIKDSGYDVGHLEGRSKVGLTNTQKTDLAHLDYTYDMTTQGIRKNIKDEATRKTALRSEATKYAFEKRKIIQGDLLIPVEGGLTARELTARVNRLKTNYVGKEVIADGAEAVVKRTSFGKVTVQLADGVEKTLPASAIVPKLDVDAVIAQQKEQFSNLGWRSGSTSLDERAGTLLDPNDTRHFGTGHYFYGSEELAKDASGKALSSVDFSGYNLFKPASEQEAMKLHEVLKTINQNTDKVAQLGDVQIANMFVGTGLDVPLEFVPKLKEIVSGAVKGDKGDTISSSIMKALGYEGVDVRGLKALDNHKFGSVIYNLRPTASIDPKSFDKAIQTFVGANSEFQKLVAKKNEVANMMAEITAKLTTVKALKTSSRSAVSELSKNLSQMTKNPNIREQVIERVKEVASKDPAFLKAAQALTETNEYIVQLAKEAGIEVPQIAGYMAHIISDDYIQFMKNYISSGKKMVGGNDKIFGRKITGSVEEINKVFFKEYGYNLFEPNAFVASVMGSKRLLNYTLAEHAKKSILNDSRFAREIPEGVKYSPAKGEFVVNASDYKIFDLDISNVQTASLFTNGKQYVVTKGAKRVLEQFKNRMQDDGIRMFIDGYGKVNTEWKKLALFSAGFHVRNHLGNNFNMWIAGMNPVDLVSYQREAVKTIRSAKKGDVTDAYKTFREQGLRESSIYEQDFKHARTPKETRTAIKRELGIDERSKLSKAYNKPLEFSRDVGTSIDEVARFALYKWSLDSGKTAEQAAKIVRETLFDYAKLTPFEQGLKSVIPFYTWTRNNVPFQIKNFLTQPGKYARMDKARDTAFNLTGMEKEDSPEWLEESFAFPVMGDGAGSGKLLGLNLPLADLSQLATPFSSLTDMVSPLVKLPLELGTNTDFFRKAPLTDFKGQKADVGGIQMPKEVAHVINQIGAVRNLAGHTKRAQDGDYFNIFTGNMFKNLDKGQADYFNRVQALNDLQDAMQRYKQQHGELPPVLPK